MSKVVVIHCTTCETSWNEAEPEDGSKIHCWSCGGVAEEGYKNYSSFGQKQEPAVLTTYEGSKVDLLAGLDTPVYYPED